MPRSQKGDTVKSYQELVYSLLRKIFGEKNVKKEWDAAKNSKDNFTRKLYCPRLDLVVGPFNIDRKVEYNNSQINRTISKHRDFIKKLIWYSETDTGKITDLLSKRNKNPRCFLAIEIENSGSRKHMLGDITNVSILGSIGIIVAFNEKKLSQFKRIKRYVMFATRVGKIKPIFGNVLIFNKEDFLRVLEESRKW